MDDITFIILKIVLSIVSALFGIVIIPLVKEKIASIKDERLRKFIGEMVQAAEQTISDPGSGALKKEEVMAKVTDWLNEHNMKITEKQLSDLIESAVYSMNHTSSIEFVD